MKEEDDILTTARPSEPEGKSITKSVRIIHRNKNFIRFKDF